MRGKGCADATTIHSLIYRLARRGRGRPDLRPQRRQRRRQGRRSSSSTNARWSTRRSAATSSPSACRCSSSAIRRSFRRSPAAASSPTAEPDVMLTEVHRQAADDPIIHLSMIVREGGAPRAWPLRREPGRRAATTSTRRRCSRADQVLVGRNNTRRSYNGRIRELLERASPVPVAGDKLVCLRNDRKRGLLNGSLWRVERARKPRKGAPALHALAGGGRGRQAPHRRLDQSGLLRRHRRGADHARAAPLGRVRLRLRAHRPQGAGLAVGRRHALRRELRLPRAPRAAGSTPASRGRCGG